MLLLYGGEMAAKLFGFFAFTRIGRLLGPESYGRLEFVLALIVFLTLPADGGLGAYAARETARGRCPVPRLLAGVAILRMLLALGSFTVLMAIVMTLPAPTGVLLTIYGLGFLLMPMQLQWLFQGRGRMEWVAAASVVRYGVFAGLIFFCLRPESSLVWIGIFEALSLLAAAALCAFVARSDLRAAIAAWPPRCSELVGHLRGSWPIGLSQLSWAALWYFATVLLGLWVAGEALGRFTASHRIVMALHTFVWMYFYNLLPTLCRTAAAPSGDMQRLLGPSLTLTSWVGGLAALLATILADDIAALMYGEAYRSAGRLLAVLIWAVPLALVSGHYRYALIACDHERQEFCCNVIGASVAVVLGVLLIPSQGAFAAAVALTVAALVVLVLARAAAREVCISVPPLYLVLPALAALLVAGLAARSMASFGNWAAAAAAAGVYLLLLALFEAHSLLRWKMRPARPDPTTAMGASRGGWERNPRSGT
jgi:O-antigen/teichoic acid export membrane protein